MKIKNMSEIPQAIEYIEQTFTSKHENHKGLLTNTLVCEEMLISLLKKGYSDISVSMNEARMPFVEIKFQDIQDMLEPLEYKNIDDEIETKINQNILEKYSDYINYEYKNGVKRYRIFFDKREKIPDLRDEIHNYYSTAKPEAKNKPLAILGYIAKNHRFFIAFSIFNKGLKHFAALTLPVFAVNIIEAVTDHYAFFSAPIIFNIIASITALAVNLFCAWLDNKIYHSFARGLETGFKMAIVRKFQILSIKYHSNTQAGKLLSKLVSDVQFIKQLVYENLTDVLHMCMDIVFVAVVSLIKMPVMLLFYVIAVPVASGLFRKFLIPVVASKAYLRKKTEVSNSAFKEMLAMERLTRSHGVQKTEYRKISEKVIDVQKAANVYDKFQIMLNNIGYGTFQGFRLLCLCCASYLASGGHITIGSVVLFQSLFDTIINSVQKVLDTMPQITQGYDSLVSVNEILFENDIELNGTKQLKNPISGEIEVKNIVFGYSQDKEPVLNNISLTVPAGKSVAFIGESGAGKTTLLNLILGLYSVQSGEILFDGENINELDKNIYRQHIAIVPQNTVLFSGTLLENLVYGLNYVTTSKVMEVLKKVGLQDLVENHPDGINRQILEGGDNFSGGQRQRIAIARALLRDPKIILFDEATSALDPENEAKVQKAIEAVMGTCTVIMVAHRMNTLKKADMIYEIKKDRAVLYNSFSEAMKNLDLA